MQARGAQPVTSLNSGVPVAIADSKLEGGFGGSRPLHLSKARYSDLSKCLKQGVALCLTNT